MTLTIYIEGGGTSKQLKTACRRGFREFLERAGVCTRSPRLVACGGRNEAFRSFRTALRGGESCMLLVDAEGQVSTDPWTHLRVRDGWNRPSDASEQQCQLMVAQMETWFLADGAAIEAYFGAGFNRSALPRNPNIEQIPREDVVAGLDRAVRGTKKKRYSKGDHSFELLRRLDPSLVRAAAPHAKRLLDTLERLTS